MSVLHEAQARACMQRFMAGLWLAYGWNKRAKQRYAIPIPPTNCGWTSNCKANAANRRQH